jgi:hypothetical protein
LGAATLLTGIEIEPPGRLNAPATDRSATVATAPTFCAGAAATPVVDAPLAAAAVDAADGVAPVVVDVVVVAVVVVVVVVAVVVLVLVGFGSETVGTVTGKDGMTIVVGKGPSAAAFGACNAKRKPSEPAATNAETCTPNEAPIWNLPRS